jgi:hypothetical protein
MPVAAQAEAAPPADEPEAHAVLPEAPAEPEPHTEVHAAEPEPQPEVHAEPVAEAPEHAPAVPEVAPPPPAPHTDVASYSDEAFSEDTFGAGAFTGGYKPRTSAGILAHEDYSGESLVSRVTEEVDIFGLPLRTEQSEPEPEPPAASQSHPTEVSAATPDVHEAPPATESHDSSVNGLFTGSSVSANDDAAASTLAGAFGGAQPPTPSEPAPERAVRPAASELSLDSVFRESPASGEGATRRESSAFSFDQFFGSENAENVSPIEGDAGNENDSAGGETEQFSSWLSGLKKK